MTTHFVNDKQNCKYSGVIFIGKLLRQRTNLELEMRRQRTVFSTCESRSYIYGSIHLQEVDKQLTSWTLWPRLCSGGLVEFIWTGCQKYAGSWTANNCPQGTLLPLLLSSQTLRSDPVSKVDALCRCREEREQKLPVPGSCSNGGCYKTEKEDPDPVSILSSEISWL